MSFKGSLPASADFFAGGDANPYNQYKMKSSQDKIGGSEGFEDAASAYNSPPAYVDVDFSLETQAEAEESRSNLQPSTRHFCNIIGSGRSREGIWSNSEQDENTDTAFVQDRTVTVQPVSIKNRSQNQDIKIVKYKFDDNYLIFVQSFTMYCEDRTNLIFDGSVLFDDAFFPRTMLLMDYVPINVVSPFVENLLLQIPSSDEYCKYAPCGSTLYDYFEDFHAFMNRENILRSQVAFILNSLQCPKLISFEIDSATVEETNNVERYPNDRLASWHNSIVSFISRHAKTIKFLQIKLTRYKNLRGSFSNTMDMKNMAKGCFPKLQEIAVTLWDTHVITCRTPDSDAGALSDEGYDNGTSTKPSVWMPAWFPDSADQYWISLMKSQVHGVLTKLCWVSAATLCWNEIFQPILDSNSHCLECVHIIEIEGILAATKMQKRDLLEKSKCSTCSYSMSGITLSCAAFSKLDKLKSLSLRKTNCYLTDLRKLPQYIEELSIDDICIKSEEIIGLNHLSNLKVLRLANTSPTCMTCNAPLHEHVEHDERFGVDKEILMHLVHLRTLQELCVWRHCLGLDIEALNNQHSFNLTAVLDKINAFLLNICNSSHKISPAQFSEWNSQQLNQDKKLFDSLEKLGFIDEECIVIHDDYNDDQ